MCSVDEPGRGREKTRYSCALVLFLANRANVKSRAGASKVKFARMLDLLCRCMLGQCPQPACSLELGHSKGCFFAGVC